MTKVFFGPYGLCLNLKNELIGHEITIMTKTDVDVFIVNPYIDHGIRIEKNEARGDPLSVRKLPEFYVGKSFQVRFLSLNGTYLNIFLCICYH